MSGKKLINSAETAVDDALEGLTMLHPGLRLLQGGHRVVVREQIEKGKVALICGGGSGHEPFCAGYVGRGMLTGAVAGSVFASPPTASILALIRAVAKDNPEGVLVLVINYTGDRIHFGLATERARREGMKVEMLVCGEDCALTSTDKSAGRRGLCGTMFVFKIAGAMAEAGRPLEEIVATAKEVVGSMGTMGLALGPCSLPGQGPLFQVAPGDIELGLGVHGEAGVATIPLTTAREAVARIIQHMTNPTSATRIDLSKGERVVVILNNLGGTSKLEELVVAREVVHQLEAMGQTVVRMWAGHMMTSLEMAGVLLSILKVTDYPEWVELLDRTTSAPAWPVVLGSMRGGDRVTPGRHPVMEETAEFSLVKGAKLSAEGGGKVRLALETITRKLVDMEARLNELDSGCGDGDCGSTLASGAQAIQAALPTLSLEHPLALLHELASCCENMGGSSGGIYSILLTSASRAFQDQVGGSVDPSQWVRALRLGLEAVMTYGGAQPGDRTMIDALYPALESLEGNMDDLRNRPGQALAKAAQACSAGATSTKGMRAQAGRASYVAQDKVVDEDPGAVAAAAWFSAVAEVFW